MLTKYPLRLAAGVKDLLYSIWLQVQGGVGNMFTAVYDPTNRATDIFAYADALAVGLLDDRGEYDASVNTFPAAGGSGTAGAILKGDIWEISVAGTLGGVPVVARQWVRAMIDTPGQTAANWAISAAGGSALTDPNVRYVRSDGNDTTGDGTLSKPYLTAQKAWDTNGSATLRLDLGVGAFGDLDCGGVGSAFLYIRGRGFGVSSLGNFVNRGATLEVFDIGLASWNGGSANTSGLTAGSNGGNIITRGVHLTDLNSNGANGAGLDQAGGNGGAITINKGCEVVNVSSDGGQGDATDGNGGSGGVVNVLNGAKVTGTISAVAGAPAGAGAPGTDGNGTFRGADVPTPSFGVNAPTVIGSIVNNVFVPAIVLIFFVLSLFSGANAQDVSFKLFRPDGSGWPTITLGASEVLQNVAGTMDGVTLNAAAVGLGNVTNAAQLVAANNLSDVANAATARTNLGAQASGSYATLGANTFTALQTITQASANAGIIASTGYSLTGSNATNMIDLAGTWNTSGAPSLIYARVTNTASGSANLIDLGTVAAGSLFKANKSGNMFSVGYKSTATAASSLDYDQNGLFMSIGSGIYINNDVVLERDAAAVLALKNSTIAQTFRVYGTWTDASNYVRLGLAATSTATSITAETAGTGADNVSLSLDGAGTGSAIIDGTGTNDSAAAGKVGEIVSSAVAVGAPVALTTNTAADVTSISVTAGDWDVEGNINFSAAAATITATVGGISSTSATLPTDGTEAQSGVLGTVVTSIDGGTMSRKRISTASTISVYLVGKSTFSVGAVSAYGSITARRVR